MPQIYVKDPEKYNQLYRKRGITFQTFQKYLKMFKIKKYIINYAILTAFSITLSGVKVENIDIVEVFVHNFFTIISSIVIGVFTAGLYSLCVLGINIFNIGLLSNALYIQGMDNLIPKLVPHGKIELFSLSLFVVYSFYTSIYLVKKVKLIFLREYNFKLFCQKVGLSFILTVIVNTIWLSIASIVEYIVY